MNQRIKWNNSGKDYTLRMVNDPRVGQVIESFGQRNGRIHDQVQQLSDGLFVSRGYDMLQQKGQGHVWRGWHLGSGHGE